MANKSTQLYFWITLILISIVISTVALYTNFQHDSKRFQIMLVTIVLVLVFQFVIGDPIKFIIQSIDSATWPAHQRRYKPQKGSKAHDRLAFLKVKLNGLKSKLLVTEVHRNENLNNSFRLITKDLWLYGKYFIILFLVILVTRDSLFYYNTMALTTLFYENHTRTYGVNEVQYSEDIPYFLRDTLVVAFTKEIPGIDLPLWEHAEQNRLLGVIRLRQIRIQFRHYGLFDAEYDENSYLPHWKTQEEKVYYKTKYWRIYEPFENLPDDPTVWERILLAFNYHAIFRSYPELIGYVTLLARNKQNSMRILQFLDEHEWLNNFTAILFMEFTLYNADCNVFSICSIRIERTPFGNLINGVEITSVRLLESIDQLSALNLICVFLYILVMLQFTKALFLKLWFEPAQINEFWNRVDLIIFILNMIVLLLILIREIVIAHMLTIVENASKMEFIDFRLSVVLHQITTYFIGFLVALGTVRLWKVLQFASVFQMFTFTLSRAWKSMANTAMVIVFLVIAFALASEIMNGNNTDRFKSFIGSAVSCVCFAFGFTSQIKPKEMFYGGRMLGLILYSLMAFSIVVVLMNLFVSIVNDHFTTAKNWRDATIVNRITYLQFLRVEYNDTIRFLRRVPCFQNRYRRKNRTVQENIKHELDLEDMQKKYKKKSLVLATPKVEEIDDKVLQMQYRLRIEKIYGLAAIMDTQLDILSLLLFENDDDDDDDDDDEQGDVVVDGKEKKSQV